MSQSSARSLDKLHRGKFANLRKGNQFHALVEDIKEQPGFNPRNYELPRLQEHIRGLADAYKRGQFVEPIVVQVVDGEIVVRDGHCRRRAMILAQEEGVDLGLVPMIEFRGDELEADALILTSQSGKKLSAVEVAAMYNRMRNRGKTEAEIAPLVGKTAQHVRDLLEFHTFPLEIKDLVAEEVVSYSLAHKTYNEFGSDALELLRNGVEEQLKKGKTKLTQKSLDAQREKTTGVRPAKINKKMATQLATHVTSWVDRLDGACMQPDGGAVLSLSAEEVDELRKLRDALPKSEAPEAAEAETASNE